jgi:hypothetical protein
VQAGIGVAGPWKEVKGQCVLGDEEFMERIKPALKDKSRVKEIGKRSRLVWRPTLDSLFGNPGRVERRSRNSLIQSAHLEFGYTLVEIGRHLGLHYTTISKIVNK